MEVLVGLRASADYSFVDSTVSDLGNTSCRTVEVAVLCSPGHAAMNAGFVWFGITLALGAVLLAAPGRWLWVVAGLGSIGVGLVPVVEHPGLHGLVALPVFVAQPIAIAVMAWRLRSSGDGRAPIAATAAVVSIVGSVVFTVFVLLDVSTGKGAFERAALWPAYLWVSLYAVSRR